MWKNIVLSQDDNEINNVLLTLRKKNLSSRQECDGFNQIGWETART